MNRILYFTIFVLLSTSLFAQDAVIMQNSSSWQLSGGQGRWQIDPDSGVECLTVIGSGKEGDSNYWTYDYPFQSNATYKISCRVKTSPGAIGNHILIGSNLVNRDVWVKTDWEKRELVFTTPAIIERSFLRFGQWQVKGTVWFHDINVQQVQSVYLQQAKYQLGRGERITDGIYHAVSGFNSFETNASRFLKSYDAYFNTMRWDLSEGDYVLFQHALAENQVSGKVRVNVAYYRQGRCLVEASTDGENWILVGEIERREEKVFELPQSLFPADMVDIRLRAAEVGARLQIYNYEYSARLSGTVADMNGVSQYADVVRQNNELAVQVQSFGPLKPGDQSQTIIQLENKSQRSQTYDVDLEIDGKRIRKTVKLRAGKNTRVELPVEKQTGSSTQRKISVQKRGSVQPDFVAHTAIETPYLMQEGYGKLLPANEDVAIWWTDGMRKISQTRALPVAKSKAIELSAAGNEYEPVQLVLRPKEKLENIEVTATALISKDGTSISARNIDFFLVEYVQIQRPSDAVGTPGLWPDPLPPLTKSFSVNAGENQPLWILVKVPKSAPGSIYNGSIVLKSANWRLKIPLKLNVYNFSLTDETHLQTAFGFSPGVVRAYHRPPNNGQLLTILEKYYQNFAEHRISPYSAFYLEDERIAIDRKRLTVTIDFSKFDRAAAKNFNQYNFNTFRMRNDGLGSGTFHSRKLGEFGGYRQGSEPYKQLMTSYLKTMQNHYQQQGLLDKAYFYWFDEPEEKDYDFVRETMSFIHEAAPKFTRMLTEQPEPELYGYVDLWCPKTSSYNHEIAERRRAEGDRFWWYICSTPTEPFCTLFIDHYAVELRTWIWQTWKYGIEGILIWLTNYWNSNAAYPDNLQNPYQDPMSYVSGYSLQQGEVKYWGNGDGRFVYPPKAVFTENTTCFDGPVSSLRWEVLREGIEDYEYLWLLRKLIERARKRGLNAMKLKEFSTLLEVPSEIASSLTEFSLLPEPIYAHREKMGRAIEWLRRELEE